MAGVDLLIASLGAAFILGAVDFFRYLGPYRGLIALAASVGLLQALGVTDIPVLLATAFASAFVSMALLRALERMDRPTTVRGRAR